MWILPTYNRPDRCKETLASIAAAGPSQGVVFIDGGDVSSYDGIALPEGWKLINGTKNRGVCGVLNFFLENHHDEPWYGFISDDSIVRSIDFQKYLVDAAGSTGFANSGDGFRSWRRMHGAVVFGGDLLRALGWWAPPGLFHSFVDDTWERISRALDNWKFLPGVMVEHMHPWNGKGEADESHRHAYERFEEDKKAYSMLRRLEIPAAIERAIPVVVGADLVKQREARFRSRAVLIATPVSRSPCWYYTNSLVETCLLLERAGVPYGRQVVIGCSNLPRARNELVARFLASDCTDILFVDDDMEWEANSVARLLGSKQLIAGGIGRKKVEKPNSDPAVWCSHVHLDEQQNLELDDMGYIRQERIGTGFLKVGREAFEALKKAHPEWKARGNPEMSDEVKENYYRFFKFGNDEFEGGEDFEFCNAWAALGGKIWADPDIVLGHIGDKNYKGSISELMTCEANP